MNSRRMCLAAMALLICGLGMTARATAEGPDADRPTAEAEAQAKQKLHKARKALTGAHKQIPLAKRILLDLAENHAEALDPFDRCHLYVYLGYIEDRAGNREAAVGWYRKATPLEGPRIQWIRERAEFGMTQPVARLRHLDGERPGPRGTGRPKGSVKRIGGALITTDMPPDLPSPRMDLSKAQRLENFEILCSAIDRYYSFFDHKDIDWQEVKARYAPKVEAVEKCEDYYDLLHDFVCELKDFHSRLCNYRPQIRRQTWQPGVRTWRAEGKVVVTDVAEGSEAFAKGLRPGSIIVRVDGLTVEAKVQALRPMLQPASSERNLIEWAHRRLLEGVKGGRVAIAFLPPGEGKPVELELRRTRPARFPRREPGFPVQKGTFVWSGLHPSGYGYIRILSFKGRDELAEQFERALEKLKDTPGLVIDVRENPGGTSHAQRSIVGRFITKRTKVAVSFQRNGPGHQDFSKREAYFEPAGDWQYTKPIALLTNSVTGSAADLFTCYLTSTGRPVTVGTTTHGNLSGVSVYVKLPCGLVVRVSTGYVCNADGRIIEVNGTEPQIRAEPTLEDVVSGTDSVLDRALRALGRARETTSAVCTEDDLGTVPLRNAAVAE